MIADRRPYRRPYFYEVFALLNFGAILAVASGSNILVITSIPQTFMSLLPTFGAYALAGVVIRAIVAATRGELRAYLRRIRTAGWITDTVRLVFFGATMAHVYFWIKLMVPLLHPRLFDQELWNLDQAMFFGVSPNILFVNVFSHTTILRVIDWSYARIFFASMTVAFSFFLSAPSRRLRVAFSTGNTVMWLMGAWLYLLIPSVGPAYRFPDVWLPLVAGLPLTQSAQAMLMRNYLQVLKVPEGTAGGVTIMFGVAAFPSLHVAFQSFAFLWMRRLWVYGQIVFGVFAFVILIGSVVTGWHYLLDGLGGLVLALVAYLIGSRLWRIPHWRKLRSALAGRRPRAES